MLVKLFKDAELIRDKTTLSLIFQSPFTERLFEPRIKAFRVNIQHITHAADIELLKMPFDERVLHFASLAKYAVAFLVCHAPR